jgi:hypothetical protein
LKGTFLFLDDVWGELKGTFLFLDDVWGIEGDRGIEGDIPIP